MNVKQIDIDKLSHDPANARLHNEKNINAICASLRRFGQQKPIVVTEDGIVVAGNGTLEAARAIGWKSIACVVTKLTNIEQTAYAIADNRTAELAAWDKDTLAKLLSEVNANADLDGTGFNTKDLDIMLKQLSGEADEIANDDLPGVSFKVLVECTSEDHQREVIESLEAEGYTCQPLML